MQAALELKGDCITNMTDDEFADFCRANDELIIERLPSGHIVIRGTAPIFASASIDVIAQALVRWNKRAQGGMVYTHAVGYRLPNSAIRKPSLAWISHSPSAPFITACPDFIVELHRNTDDLRKSKSKMKEWIANGCRLAWLIDEKKRVVYSYERSKVRTLVGFDKPLSGDPVLEDFSVRLSSTKFLSTLVLRTQANHQ